MTIVDVFHRQLHRCTYRFRGVTHVVVRFILRLQTVDDLHRFLNGRFSHVNFLEAARQRTVFFEDVAELLVGRGANHADLAAGEQRFDQVSGIHLATGRRTCADDGVDLIDKQNAVGVLLQLF
ncbi:Protein of uncharacterised function (DUF3170) [Enterobacter kobei]|nr:Protein of uncharacterised function (DUF3170) [Enterobacter kobei]